MTTSREEAVKEAKRLGLKVEKSKGGIAPVTVLQEQACLTR